MMKEMLQQFTNASALITTVATVAVAYLTWRYVLFTRQLVEESRANRSAEVFIDIDMGNHDIKLVIGNTGRSAARNITLKVSDDIPWRESPHYKGLSNLAPVLSGISYLAPGRILKYTAGHVDWNRDKPITGYAKFVLGYESSNGARRTEEFSVSLAEYDGVLLESFSNPSSQIAREISRLRDEMRSNQTADKFVSRIFKKNCPYCGKSVSASARKCPHCLEFLKNRNWKSRFQGSTK